ncbi:MAG: DUF4345 domain-containing protein [Mycobacterium sp.]
MKLTVIGFVAVFFLGMGLYGLARPAALIRPFGISLPSTEARAEVRAVYGGFGVAIAAILAVAATGHAMSDGILITVATALVGMALGRLVSGVVDTPKAFYPNWFYLLVELVLAGALVWAVYG